MFSKFKFKAKREDVLQEDDQNEKRLSEEERKITQNCRREANETEHLLHESMFEDEIGFDISFHDNENEGKKIEAKNIVQSTKELIKCSSVKNTISQQTIALNEKCSHEDNAFDDDFNDEAFETMLIEENSLGNTCEEISTYAETEDACSGTGHGITSPLRECSSNKKTCSESKSVSPLFINNDTPVLKASTWSKSLISMEINEEHLWSKEDISSIAAQALVQNHVVSESAIVSVPFQRRSSSLLASTISPNEPLERTVRKRKFPGPAGLLPDPLEKNKVHMRDLQTSSHHSLPDYKYSQELCSQSTVEDFQGLAWQEMLKQRRKHFNVQLLERYNIRNILQSAKRKCLPKHVVAEVLCVMLKKLNREATYADAIFKDETGEIAGKIDANILDAHEEYFLPGTVIVLKQVSVLLNQLILKAENLVAIYDCDGRGKVISDFSNEHLRNNTISDCSRNSSALSITNLQSVHSHREMEVKKTPATNVVNGNPHTCDDLLEDGLDDLLQQMENFEE